MRDKHAPPRRPATTFSTEGSTPGAIQGPAGGGTFVYADLVRVSARRPDELAADPDLWAAYLHAYPTAATQAIRMYCDEEGCEICHTAPPCKSPVEPLLVGPQQVAIAPTAKVADCPELGMAELRFGDATDPRRIPVLDAEQPLARQLRRWHDEAFGPQHTVVYHLYEIERGALSDDAGARVTLDRKLIAIPVKPVRDAPTAPPRPAD